MTGQRLRKTGTVALSAMLGAALILSGCSKSGNKENASPTASPSGSASASAASPTTEAPLEISWMVPQLTEEGGYGQKYLEEKFNIKIKPYLIASNDYAQKQQVTLGGGDIPDVMMVLDPVSLQKYASQGLLAEVPVDTIAQNMPDYKAILDEQVKQGYYYTAYEGKNYGFVTFYPNGRYNSKADWRTDLLKKAGIDKIPETIDEMTAAFAALKKIGVYGLSSGAPNNSWYGLFKQIFGAYGVMPMQWMLKDGKVVNGATQPEAKEALAQLADWYKKGYIDPDFVTGKDYKEKFIAGSLGYYDYGGSWDTDETNEQTFISLAKQTNPEAAIEWGPLPKGPKGESGDWSWGTAGNIIAFGKQLEKDPDKMKKIMEIFNTVDTSEQYFVDLVLGQQGVHWDYADPAKKEAGGAKALPPYDNFDKRMGMGLGDASNTNPFTRQFAFDITDKWSQDLTEKNKQFNNPKSDLFGKPDVLPSAGQYWEDLKKLKTDTYFAIILGTKPVDAFDDFVKQWNEQGGAQLEKEANELYAQVNQ